MCDRPLPPPSPQVVSTIQQVEAMVAPLEAACAAEVARLQEQEAQRLRLEQAVLELQRKAANVE